MVRKLAIAGCFMVVAAMALAPQTASAVTIGPHSKIPPIVAGEDSLVQPAQLWPYCRFVRRECAERWAGARENFISAWSVAVAVNSEGSSRA